MRASWHETPVNFGPGGYLSGIWSGVVGHEGRPTFLFLNAGLVHRVGPSRTYVMIARELARAGFASLRFDHGGVGDSGSRTDGANFEDGAADEVVQAMDFLETQYGSSSFVLVGLCSGARTALRVGAEDARVAGVVSLDGQRFPTWRFWLHRYKGRRRSLLGAVAWRLMPKGPAAEVSAPLDVPRMTLPTKDKVEEDLRTLVTRGAHQYWIFTGGFSDKYNYRNQHRDAFGGVQFGELLKLDFMPGAGHTLTGYSDQAFVIESVAHWAKECFGA